MDENLVLELIDELRTRGHEWKTVDAKRELTLHENGDKAEFVKDILAMANNGERSHIIVGLEDSTFRAVGRLTHHYDKNTLNQIIGDKADPPVIVDYKEYRLEGSEYALIEINGANPPYLVARDFTANKTDRKQTRIYKGTIFVRHEDRTVGISRAELDEFSRRREPEVTIGLELEQSSQKSGVNAVTIRFFIVNDGPGAASNIQATLWLTGCELLSCPSFEHGHITTHKHDKNDEITEIEYERRSLLVDVPLIQSNASEQVGTFTLKPTRKRHCVIGVTLKGSNISSRDISIDLADISKKYRNLVVGSQNILCTLNGASNA